MSVINQQEATYTHEDTILYALALGFGADPVDDKQLRYVYEENLRALGQTMLPIMFMMMSYTSLIAFSRAWFTTPPTEAITQ